MLNALNKVLYFHLFDFTVGFIHDSERKIIQQHQGDDYYDDEDDDSYDSDEEEVWSHSRTPNNNDIRVVQSNASSNKQKTTLQPQSKQFGKFVGKIKLEKYQGMNILFFLSLVLCMLCSNMFIL